MTYARFAVTFVAVLAFVVAAAGSASAQPPESPGVTIGAGVGIADPFEDP